MSQGILVYYKINCRNIHVAFAITTVISCMVILFLQLPYINMTNKVRLAANVVTLFFICILIFLMFKFVSQRGRKTIRRNNLKLFLCTWTLAIIIPLLFSGIASALLWLMVTTWSKYNFVLELAKWVNALLSVMLYPVVTILILLPIIYDHSVKLSSLLKTLMTRSYLWLLLCCVIAAILSKAIVYIPSQITQMILCGFIVSLLWTVTTEALLYFKNKSEENL